MRHLTRTSIVLDTKEPIEDLNKVKGIHNVEEKNNSLYFHVDSDQLDGVMKYVSQFGIVKLEIAPPTLEDLFMRYYKGDGGEL